LNPTPAGTVDHRLAKALSHPLRARILAILNARVASPNEMATELEEPLGNVSYHVRMLVDLECIELVRTAQRRGAIEHYYRAIERPFYSDLEWRRLPTSARRSITDLGLQMVWKEAEEAVSAGTFEAREDRHLSRSPLVLDEQGWTEVNDLLSEVLEKVQKIESDSAARLAKSDTEGINAKLVMMHFESPRDESK
jgi:DNA-binding transcriptional ArsR family regulator